jgi:hypothetical protein
MRKKFNRLPASFKDLIREMGAFADTRSVALFFVCPGHDPGR